MLLFSLKRFSLKIFSLKRFENVYDALEKKPEFLSEKREARENESMENMGENGRATSESPILIHEPVTAVGGHY